MPKLSTVKRKRSGGFNRQFLNGVDRKQSDHQPEGFTEKMNQYQMKQMTEILFKELVIINDKNCHSGHQQLCQTDLYANRNIRDIALSFEDPEVLEHYLARVNHLMYEKDAFSQATEQFDARYGITPEDFQN